MQKKILKLWQKYRRMARYRDGEYLRDFSRDSLRKMTTFTLMIALVLTIDLAVFYLSGSQSVLQAGAMDELKKLTAGLACTGLFSLTFLRESVSTRVREMGRAIALLILLVCCYTRVVYYELQLSGGLYVHVIFLLVLGTVINLRLRESALFFFVADLVIIYAHYVQGIPIAAGQIYLTPAHMLVFCTVSALLLSFQRNYEYLTLIYQRAKMKQASEIDTLTGLLNRRGMEAKIRQRGRAESACAAIFDIDDFKKYNDTYGHAAGDDCLHTVAELLQRTAEKHHGLAVRYGGEEMVLLFFTSRLDNVRKVLQKSLEELRRRKLPTGLGATHKILTLSCGLAVSNKKKLLHDVDAYYQLIAEADKNLYIAKSNGKDCIIG